MKLGEFFIELVVDAGEGVLTLGELVKKMGELEAVSVGELAVLFEMAEKLANMTMAAVGTALSIEQVVSKTGVSQREFQKWTSIVAQAHVTGDAFSQAVVGVGAALTDLHHGVGGQELLSLNRLLGIDLSKYDSKHVIELFEAIRQSRKFQQMGAAEQDELLRKTGDGLAGILLYLQKSDQQIAEYGKHTAVFSQKGYKDLLEIATRMQQLKQDAMEFGNEIVQWDAPKLLQVLNGALELVKLLKAEFKEYEGAVRKADVSAPSWTKNISFAPGLNLRDLTEQISYFHEKFLDVFGRPLSLPSPGGSDFVGPVVPGLGAVVDRPAAPVVNVSVAVDGKDIPARVTHDIVAAGHFATEKLKAWHLLGGQQGGSR